MKSYVIDELRPEDFEKLTVYLNNSFQKSSIEGVYRLEIPESMLTEIQRNHTACAPHYFTLELDRDRLSCGFLVQTASSLRCDCIGYATTKQRHWLMDTIDMLMVENAIIC